MDSRRQSKVSSLFKEAFTEILNREGKRLYGKALVTVTNAKVTSDLTLVRFYLSVFNAENPDEVVDTFNTHKFELKRALSDKLRHHVRRIPEVEFFKDETLDYVFHMDDVFKKIKEEDEQLKSEIAKPKITKPRAKSTRKK